MENQNQEVATAIRNGEDMGTVNEINWELNFEFHTNDDETMPDRSKIAEQVSLGNSRGEQEFGRWWVSTRNKIK